MNGQRTYGVRELANWILDYADRRGVFLTNMSLNKLAYFAYEWALVQHGRKLTSAKIEAWEHGPVFREIYRSFKDFGDQPIRTRAKLYDPASNSLETVVPQLSPADQKIVEESIAPLVRLSASVLRDLSHDVHSPWAVVWNHPNPTNPGMQITDDAIRTCHESKGVRQ